MGHDIVSEIEFDRAHRIGKVKVGSVRTNISFCLLY